MYRFQVSASTQLGESIAIVGSTPELGQWDLRKCVHLYTNSQSSPLWWADVKIDLNPDEKLSSPPKIEYKYVRFSADGRVQWETEAENRWIPLEFEFPTQTIIVDDGKFGQIQPYPYGYFTQPVTKTIVNQKFPGQKILVIGSSVALGCSAWLLRGWAWHLEQELRKSGHILVNKSELGANVSTTIDRFPLVVAPEKPDIVIIALSLGNEGLAYCLPHERRAVQRRFESGLQQLAKMTRELGARPILGGLYSHNDYNAEHNWLLRDTHKRMLNWGIPLLDWLDSVDNGEGRWQLGTSFDAAHPNSLGHLRMYDSINMSLFSINKEELTEEKQLSPQKQEVPIYRDNLGLHIFACQEEKSLRIINTASYPYSIHPTWEALQTALYHQAGLMPGLYIVNNEQTGSFPGFFVGEYGTIETKLEILPNTDIEYRAAFNFFLPENAEILFYDGHLGILKENEQHIRIINESENEYNVQPMWKEVSDALSSMTLGVYDDPIHPDVPFQTMMIGNNGLESRVKIPPKSSLFLKYKCKLAEISRIAILPIGDRCAIRMLLYKMQYDGPAFPFDLTRTTNLGDVADIIANDFQDMWNPDFLHYNSQEKRIYHSKWTGLSFAHEVEDTDDTINNMATVHERMRIRYSARAQRFLYTLEHCDEVLFIRTGVTNRDYVVDLVDKLEAKCKGKLFRILIISQQRSDEFLDIPQVFHYNLHFSPDWMYENLAYWLKCTKEMYSILESLGVSSKNLFWCPPNPPKSQTRGGIGNSELGIRGK